MDRVEPDSCVAKQVLPPPLLRALRHIFAQGLTDVMLVGGTALAGFYAGHRRSDDLDLFAATPQSHRATVLAVKSLATLGAKLSNIYTSQYYFNLVANLDQHNFTVDVVLDRNLFTIGEFHSLDNNIAVASLDTLLRTKAATLISRCSEKDLFDLAWIFEHRDVSILDLIDLGHTIDGGVNAESLLMSLASTTLRRESCNFGLDDDRDAIFATVQSTKASIEHALSEHLHGLPPSALSKTITNIRRWSK